MKKFQLLDNREFFEYELITYIFENNFSVSKKKILENFFIMERTLKSMIDSINERIAPYTEEKLILFDKHTKNYFIAQNFRTLERMILAEYVTASVNFQILDFILNDPHLTIENCIQRTMISRANFFRRLKQINELLSEFDLTVRNCRLVGDEGQIQYFRQQFYQNIYPEKYLYSKTKQMSQLEKLITLLEDHLSSKFSYYQKAKLMYWFSYFIGKQEKPSSMPTRLHNFVKNKATFQQLTKIIKPFFLKFGIQLSLSDLAYTFVFIISDYLVPKHADFWEQLLNESFSENDLIAKRLEILTDELKKSTVDEECDLKNYYLYGGHVTACFLKGEIEYLDEEQLIEATVFHKEQIKKAIDKYFEEDKCATNNFLARKYYLYLNSQSASKQKIRIGMALYLDPVITEYYFKRLSAELLTGKAIGIEDYDPEEQYDLVIADSENHLTSYNYQKKYIFSSGIFSAIETIRILIREIKIHKNNYEK